MWATMNKLYPKPDTDDSRLGNAAHWALYSQWFEDRQVKAGDTDPDGHPIDAEMLANIAPVVRHMRMQRAQATDVIAETFLPCPSVSPHNGGSSDGLFINRKLRRARVDDFKYGHDSVQAVGNWQLLNYGCILLDHLGLSGVDEDHWTLTFAIHQPRDFTPGGSSKKEWTIRASEIRPYRNILANAAGAATKDGPIGYQSGDHCQHCPGAAVCPALQNSGILVRTRMEQGAPHELTPLQMRREVEMLATAQTMVKARLDALRDEMTLRYTAGERGFGFILDSVGTTPRKWTADTDKIVNLGVQYNVKMHKAPELITPTQAINAGIPESKISEFSERGRAAPKLIPIAESPAFRAFSTYPVKVQK